MIIRFNKPFSVLTQFTDAKTGGEKRPTLSDYIDLPNVYAAGRLDKDSEGLLILTDDGKLQSRISNPKFKMPKTYWVQVEGEPSSRAIDQLRNGIILKDGPTKPATVKRIDEPPNLWPRNSPVRVRKSIPDCWLEITLAEGRNRQVRRMTAAVGHPTLRLIRYRIGNWTLDGLNNGQWEMV